MQRERRCGRTIAEEERRGRKMRAGEKAIKQKKKRRRR